jgi:CheY-like chemotaxis protein
VKCKTMSKRVLDVGNCMADHSSITRVIEEQFDAEVIQAHGWDDALEVLKSGAVDLILVNRRLDRDHSEGLEIIRRVKADPTFGATPCMLLTNFAQHQATAQESGAETAFGKAELDQPETLEKLRRYLE